MKRHHFFISTGLPALGALLGACATDTSSDGALGDVQFAVSDRAGAGCAQPTRFCGTAEPSRCVFGCPDVRVPSNQCAHLLEAKADGAANAAIVCTSAPGLSPLPPAACNTDECGPAPAIPTYTCSDGSSAGRGDCERNAEGQCGWVITECPEQGEIQPDGTGVACALFLEESDAVCGRVDADPCRFQDPDCGVPPPSGWCPVVFEAPEDGECTRSDDGCTHDPDCPTECETVGGVRQPDGSCVYPVPNPDLCPTVNGDGLCELTAADPCFVKDTDCVCDVFYVLPVDGVCSVTDACTSDPDCPTPTPSLPPAPAPDCDGDCGAQGASCANGETCCAGLECCAGVPVSPGQEFCGAICPKSDRNLKEAIEPVDPATILELVARLPISAWSYKTEPSRRHIGPMAQDFMATFGIGSSDQTILQVDGDGVALASIQALHRRLERLERENRGLAAELERLRQSPAWR